MENIAPAPRFRQTPSPMIKTENSSPNGLEEKSPKPPRQHVKRAAWIQQRYLDTGFFKKNSHPPTCCHITPDPPAPP